VIAETVIFYIVITWLWSSLTDVSGSPWAAMLSRQHVTYKPSKLGQTDLVFGP